MSKIGKQLRRARVEEGLSQAEVAAKISVTQGTISNWEKGTSKPDSVALKSLHKLFGPFDTQNSTSEVEGGNYLPSGTAFGDWLKRARLSKGFSVRELADRTGLSSVAIYNLESGQSQNPQAHTKETLERVLGDVPADVSETVSEEQKIEGLGELTDFDPHDRKNLPDCAGVYVFYDVSDRPVYVGKASKIRDRVNAHHDKFWFKFPIVSNGSYVKITDPDLRGKIEQVLIKFLKSNAVINKQGVERE